MATLAATPANLDTLVADARAGDVLQLAPGAYGDRYWKGYKPTGAVSIQAADPTRAPVFRTIVLNGCANFNLAGLTIAYTPTRTSPPDDSALRLQDSSGINLSNLVIRGAPAINPTDLVGWPSCRGVTLNNAAGAVLSALDIAGVDRGVVLNNAQKVTIQGCKFGDRRRSAIVGGPVTDLLIDNNDFADANPYNWGAGDHADYIALWGDGKQSFPNARIRITNNRMSGAEHKPVAASTNQDPSGILGIWFQGKPTPAASGADPEAGLFVDWEISGNTLDIANLQGLAFWGAKRGKIASNTLTLKAGSINLKNAPGILIRDGCDAITLTNNAASVIDDKSGGKNPASGTILTVSGLLPPSSAKPAPTPDPRDAQIADLTAKLSAAATSTADLSAKLASVTSDRDAQAAKVSSLQAALDGATAAAKTLRDALTAIQSQATSALA